MCAYLISSLHLGKRLAARALLVSLSAPPPTMPRSFFHALAATVPDVKPHAVVRPCHMPTLWPVYVAMEDWRGRGGQEQGEGGGAGLGGAVADGGEELEVAWRSKGREGQGLRGKGRERQGRTLQGRLGRTRGSTPTPTLPSSTFKFKLLA